jgi:POT family proton-dependent oligopeptide transporter
MAIATFVFWLGRNHYVHVPPTASRPRLLLRASRSRPCAGPGRAGGWPAWALVGAVAASRSSRRSASSSPSASRWSRSWRSAARASDCTSSRARGHHPDEAVDGVRSVLRVLVLFALVTPFWSLFDQKASTWVLQADAMTPRRGSSPRRCRR